MNRQSKIISMVLIASIVATLFMPVALADNPLVQTNYTADPAPVVFGDTLYLYTSHDDDVTVGGFFTMDELLCYSTTDMVNWTDHGAVTSTADFTWAQKNTLWASQVIERNGKYYAYIPFRRNNGSGEAIGVGISDSPTGPFSDALGRPLIAYGSWAGDIDPCVFIDDDGQAYLYWGNPQLRYVKLNEDMISYSGSIVNVPMTVESFAARPGFNPDQAESSSNRRTTYEEGPWLYKRNDLYYLFYPGGPLPEHLAYSTSSSPTGPWVYGGVIMDSNSSLAFTNHPGVVDYKGSTYLFYHCQRLTGGGGYKRSVSVEKVQFNGDGTIPKMAPTTAGVPAIATLNPYARTEAETIAYSTGLKPERCSQGGMNIRQIHDNDYIKVANVDFGTNGASTFVASVACGNDSPTMQNATVELRLGSRTGTLIGTLPVPYTGGWDTWTEKAASISGAAGVNDLYLVFKGHSGELFKMDYWKFVQKSETKVVDFLEINVDRFEIDKIAGTNTANMAVTAFYSDGAQENVTSQATTQITPTGVVSISNGVITGIGYGNAEVQVSFGGMTRRFNIAVADLSARVTPASIAFNQDSMSVFVGGGQAFTATATFLDGRTEDVTLGAVYTYSTPGVAEVSNGKIYGLSLGTTVITATYTGLMGAPVTNTLPVTVTESSIPTDGLDVWFSGDVGVTLNDNGRVTGWQSRGAKAATALASANPKPGGTSRLPLVGSYNGMPTVRYDNSELTFNYPVNGLTGMTIISLSSHTGTRTGGEYDSVVYWDESGGWGKLYFSPKRDRVQFRFGTGQNNNNVEWTRPSNIGTAFSVTAVTKSGATERTYVNGSLVNTATGKQTTLANNYDVGYLGTSYYSSWGYCAQEVAELLIYNRALTAQEITEIQMYLDVKYAPVDKSKLQTLVNSANDMVNEGQYTSDSWSALQTALANAKSVLADTGTSQANVNNALRTLQDAIDGLEPEDLPDLSNIFASNPIVQTTYTADPAPIVYNDTVYLYTGQDLETATTSYKMTDWKCYSSKDMVNWTDHGSVLTVDAFSWARHDQDANASHVIYNPKTNKFYYFVSVSCTLPNKGGIALGVAVSDSPTGPFVDAIGAPLVTNDMTKYATHSWDDLDPAVFIDDDGQAYVIWGNNACYWAKLNDEMTALTSEIGYYNIADQAQFGPDFEEAPWMYKRGDLYYLLYASKFPETISYSTSSNIAGPWTFGGEIMGRTGSNCSTIHPGIIDYKGESYFFYHKSGLPGGGDYKRAVCVEKFTYGVDGTIPFMPMTGTGGVTLLQTLNPYARVEAETIASSNPLLGIKTEKCSQGGLNITSLDDGDYTRVAGLNFGEAGAGTFTASVASSSAGGSIELRLDSSDGKLVGVLPVTYTGGNDVWKTLPVAVSGATGVHDLFMVFKGAPGQELFKLDYWKFTKKTEAKDLVGINVMADSYYLGIGEQANMKVTAVYSNGEEANVTAQSTVTAGDPSVATYANGVITSVAVGTANFNLSYEGFSAMLKVTVYSLVGDLRDLIDRANGLLQQTNLYTEESLAGLSAAISAATAVYNNPEASPSELSGAIQALSQAIESLKIKSGIMVWYKFDETSGTTAYDASGNGYHAAVMGGALFNEDGSGINLNNSSGQTKYVNLPKNILEYVPGDFTVSTMVYFRSGSNFSRIFDFGPGSSSNIMFLTANTLQYNMDNANARTAPSASNNTNNANRWRLITITHQGNTTTMYIDGARVTSGNQTSTAQRVNSSYNYYIGRSNWSADPYPNIMMRDFRIYNQALSAGEVAKLYQQSTISINAVEKLVAGCAANVTVRVEASGLDGLKASLFGKTIEIKDGTAKFAFTASEIPDVNVYKIDILDGNDVVASRRIEVVAEPVKLWTPDLVRGESGFTITFGSPISFYEIRKSVTIDGVPVDDELVKYDGSVLTVEKAVSAGQKVVVTGVMYKDLFPSYSFTFTVIAGN